MTEVAEEIAVSLKRGFTMDVIPGIGTMAQRLQALYGVTILDDLPTGRRALISVTPTVLAKIKAELGDKCHVIPRGIGELHTA